MEPQPAAVSPLGVDAERASLRRLLAAIALLSLLTLGGALGYALLEGYSFIDALYMSVITLSTVGYSEVATLSPAGRLYTVVFILVGVGLVFYTIVTLAQFLLEGHLRAILGRRGMEKQIAVLRDHVVVCGFGRLGRAVVAELDREGVSVVLVDPDPELARELEGSGRLLVTGSALEEVVLRAAGVERARAVVTATPSDPENVFIALSARELNSEIVIHARGETPQGIRRLRLAGADQVISPHHLAGQRIATAIARPAVVDFIELAAPRGGEADINLEEVVLAEGCALCGRRLGDLPGHDVHVAVVALLRGLEAARFTPRLDVQLCAGDRVVVVGDQANLTRLAQLARAEGAPAPGA